MHSLINFTHTHASHERERKRARVCCWREGHHKPTKRNTTQTIITHITQEGPSQTWLREIKQTIYKHTHIMHSLINLTHTRESRTRKKTARVCCWTKGHHKPTKRNKTQTIITHSTQEGPS